MQVVLAVGLGPGVWASVIGAAVEPVGGTGTKQPDWQVAACALQVIMQVVVAEVCVELCADARDANAATASATNKTVNPRMTAPAGLKTRPPL
jgi:hypothetical protein